jgi:hypothetical protein
MERALEVPHLVVPVTPEGQVMLRSNVSADVLRSFGEDLIELADNLTALPEPGDNHALIRQATGASALTFGAWCEGSAQSR